MSKSKLTSFIVAAIFTLVGLSANAFAQCPGHGHGHSHKHGKASCNQTCTPVKSNANLKSIDVKGTLIIEKCNDSKCTVGHYMLDTNNDGKADYKLRMGPAKQTDKNLPKAGDKISVVGKLVENAKSKEIIVSTINGKEMPRRHKGKAAKKCCPSAK